MKGKIVQIDVEQATGTIVGEDGWEYGFLLDHVNASNLPEVGWAVEFDPVTVAFTAERVAMEVLLVGNSGA